MHIVYRLIFNKRKSRNEEPYMYIGSKSNCIVENNLILDSLNKPYFGSSAYLNYHEIVKEDDISIEVINVFENYTDALNYESALQKSLDVVADIKYFNLSIATTNTFTNPNYATYKHTKTGKIVRLNRDHEMVKNGEYVGISKGYIHSEETKNKISRKGEKNHFFGKKHNDNTKKKIGLANSRNTRTPEQIQKWIEEVAKKTKTEEHKAKIGRKGLIMLKNVQTNECIRISKEERLLYDANVWMNPYSVKILREKEAKNENSFN